MDWEAKQDLAKLAGISLGLWIIWSWNHPSINWKLAESHLQSTREMALDQEQTCEEVRASAIRHNETLEEDDLLLASHGGVRRWCHLNFCDGGREGEIVALVSYLRGDTLSQCCAISCPFCEHFGPNGWFS